MQKTFQKPKKSIPEIDVGVVLSAQAGDAKALSAVVKHHERLVDHVIKRYRLREHPHVDDIRQEGLLGIVDAVRRFDPSRGYKFLTYVGFRIRIFIFEYVRTSSKDTLGMNSTRTGRTLFYRYFQAQHAVEKQSHHVTPQQIADHLNIPVEDVEMFYACSVQRPASLDQPVREDDEHSSPLYSLLRQDEDDDDALVDQIDSARTKNKIFECLSRLSAREQFVLESLHLREPPANREDVAQVLGCTSQNVGLINKNALRKLRILAVGETYDDGVASYEESPTIQ